MSSKQLATPVPIREACPVTKACNPPALLTTAATPTTTTMKSNHTLPHAPAPAPPTWVASDGEWRGPQCPHPSHWTCPCPPSVMLCWAHVKSSRGSGSAPGTAGLRMEAECRGVRTHTHRVYTTGLEAGDGEQGGGVCKRWHAASWHLQHMIISTPQTL